LNDKPDHCSPFRQTDIEPTERHRDGLQTLLSETLNIGFAWIKESSNLKHGNMDVKKWKKNQQENLSSRDERTTSIKWPTLLLVLQSAVCSVSVLRLTNEKKIKKNKKSRINAKINMNEDQEWENEGF
jgi:hypothetical protein